ncbi:MULTISPECIES: SixA phosphatase family protein [Microbacterium]|uniref:Phosphohistidine phosphatase n=1 Tax=Microbacterium wangchenii TaxID=2541726 RepID=A0ABX5SWD5_9MICO|nr:MULTISPECIES: histidine phosphatase family protein [Microbacterium]MCK6067653.1 histidine phosphatase family protein [Microbacterium sp. EYE_512]QBR89428.1 phosphohistidine phosphatase [Microbacterium wangchenii]TXK11101.1 phosphohistidine phosphatase [Microbacterium wangchenii]
MIQLALARHAKSDWADASVDDHDRPLNAQGQRDAPEVARRVLRTGVRPEVILTSTALRARSTAEHFAAAFDAEVRESEDLYLADADALLQAARDSGADEVLVVAHDPGMSELVSELAGREVSMPTSAVAVFTWESGGWDAVGTTPPDDVTLTTP